MYLLKGSSPNIEPCGAPMLQGFRGDELLFTCTH